MAKARNNETQTDIEDGAVISTDAPLEIDSRGNYRIAYVQGDEEILLTYFTAERRDAEYSRLVTSGIRGDKIDVE